MEQSEVNKDSPNNMNLNRRSIKVKNLEEQVELILSQEECDDDDHTEAQLPQTPSTSADGQQQSRAKDGTTPRVSEMTALKELMQTPRRSCRKSVKPAQDYDDIVKKSLRSVGRSAKKSLMIFDEEENEENMECLQVGEDSQPKWTTAVVGKCSTKRSRKSKRNTTTSKGKKNKVDDENKEESMMVVNGSSGSQSKPDLDSVISKDSNEDNSSGKDEVSPVMQATLHQDIPAIEDTVENDRASLENAKEIVDDVDTVHKQSLQSVGVCVMADIEIENSKANCVLEEVTKNEETAMEVSEQTEKVNEGIDVQEQHTNNVYENVNATKADIKEEDIHLIQEDSEDIHLIQEDSEDIHLIQEDSEDIHLIQEDSEDIKELPFNVNIDHQISSADVKFTENVNDKDSKESSNDSFGSYLKSNKINVTDLGLIPLRDDDEGDDDDVEETGDNKAKASAHITEAEEMPSLIILDDEEDEATNNEEMAKECSDKPTLNETFEAINEIKREVIPKQSFSFEAYETVDNSLQSFLQNEAATIVGDEEPVEMDALKMSDDENTPRRAPRIVLTTTDKQNKTILSTPIGLSTSHPSTPKHKAKPFKFPTPYRNKYVEREPTSSSKKLPVHHNNMGLALTSLEPREIVLRGIRKRSISICLGDDQIKDLPGGSAAKRQRPLKGPLATHRQQKAVNFYSPANRTTIIDDLDRVIEDSVRKDKKCKIIHQITNVTTRRKRSLSLDESMMSKSFMSKIPRAGTANIFSFSKSTAASSSTSTSSSSKLSRTKLPNFAAIHQKRFQKMENLVDHVARKQERSKILINSATKIKTASAQKNISSNKMDKSGQLEKPKALKKIDLEGTSQMKVKPLYNSLAVKPIRKVVVSSGPTKPPTKENNCTLEESSLPHPRDLPHPRVFKYINKYQQDLVNKKHLKPTQSINVLANKKSSTSTPVKKQQQPQKQPAQQQPPPPQKPFNLSTQLPAARPQVVKPKTTSTSTTFTASSIATTSSSSFSSSASFSSLSTQNKMTSRLQRHMDLFKGRAPPTRAGVASRNIDANIRGVRSNRRFELQMQHRKNLEN